MVNHSLHAADATMASPVIASPRLSIVPARVVEFHGCTSFDAALSLRRYIMTTGPPVGLAA